jgi:uncharacterized caspase-like protein
MPRLFAALILIGLAIALPDVAAAAKRVALVIGNSAYKHAGELTNPKSDAADIAAALEKLGFLVITGTDLDKSAMERAIRRFAREISGADAGLFFYAGHGIQVSGQNYLIPTDAKLEDTAGIDFELIRLDLLQRTMETEARTNILFLDACRDNPLARNLARAMGTRSAAIGKGLASVESGIGTLISFSTQPGNVALDGTGRNSPFAGALVRHLTTSTDDLNTILINVRNDVVRETRDKQVPWEHSALRGRFWFKGAPPPSSPPVAAVAAPLQSEVAQTWKVIESSEDVSVFEAFRKQFGPSNPVYDQLAASRIATLKRSEEQKLAALQPPPAAAPRVPSPQQGPPEDSKALAEALQRELQRVGCYTGKIDGEWGPGMRSALASFNLHAKMALPTARAEARSVEAVRKMLTRVCPEDRPAPTKTSRQAPSVPTDVGQRSCREETVSECRARVCPYTASYFGGPCACLPSDRKRICE